MIRVVLLGLAVWLVVAVIVALVVGRVLAACSPAYPEPPASSGEEGEEP